MANLKSELGWKTYDYIANKLNGYKQEFGPDFIAGISSSRCTNEENYLMQKFIRAVIGTNNIDGCAQSPAPYCPQRHTLWRRPATNSIEDIKHTNLARLSVRQQSTDAHPVMTGAKLQTVCDENG
ncbi:MAG: molybdopterin-dependent oxidoreductase [Bacteroidia bacterium]